MIKIVVPQMCITVVDRAIQVFGGAGVSSDTVLPIFFTHARTLRIADGPDEVHTVTVSKLEIASQIQAKL